MKKLIDEPIAEDMTDVSAENDESSVEDSTWLQDFVDHLTPDEVSQLRDILSKQEKASNNGEKSKMPSYDSFKKVTES